MTEDKYVQRRDHCLLMAELAPTEGIRESLLRMAQLCEIEARLVKHAALRISESRAAIAKADALLEGATDYEGWYGNCPAIAPDDSSFEASPRSRSRSSH